VSKHQQNQQATKETAWWRRKIRKKNSLHAKSGGESLKCISSLWKKRHRRSPPGRQTRGSGRGGRNPGSVLRLQGGKQDNKVVENTSKGGSLVTLPKTKKNPAAQKKRRGKGIEVFLKRGKGQTSSKKVPKRGGLGREDTKVGGGKKGES